MRWNNSQPPRPLPRLVAACAAPALTLTLAFGAPPAGELQARARVAYDAGNCGEALPILQQLGAKANVGGAWLYRLYYCQREASDPAARETMQRARETLAREFDSTPDLETGFYLANVYRNVGRPSAAAEVAEAVTGLIESSRIDGPKTPMQTFQLGKLYADRDRPDRAAELYVEALEGLVVPGEPVSPTAQWAARYLAERASKAEDWPAAAKYYGMIDTAGASAEDYDRMAVALVRGGEYRAAARAWFGALRMNPAGGDRPRYCGQLANQAAEIAPLPETAPDGRAWSELSGEDLGQILYENAQFANATQQEAADPEALTPERRRELSGKLQTARAAFITAGLEAAVRGIPLRETAFQSGYAPLIFHKTRWFLPRPPGGSKRWRPPKNPPEPVTDDPQSDGSAGS